jgi:predicted naringenin-chalcone synthase
MPEHHGLSADPLPLAPAASARPGSCAHIVGRGAALPPHRLAQRDALAFALRRNAYTDEQRAWVTRRYRHSQVDYRYSIFHSAAGPADPQLVGTTALTDFYPEPAGEHKQGPSTGERMDFYRRHAPGLACEAARAALADVALPPSNVGHLVMVSCTGFIAPGIDVELIERLNLPAGIQRTHVGFMGCHGAVNGLRIAKAVAEQAPGTAVLLVCVELCTLHFQYGFRSDQVVANALFGDGAAAVVLRAAETVEEAGDHQVVRPARTIRVVDTQCRLLAGSRDDMGWVIGDHGFEMRLSRTVPASVRAELPAFTAGWLASHGLAVADIAGWAVHPGGPRILDAVGSTLSLPDDALAASWAVLRRIGNVSSGTVLFVLDDLLGRGIAGPIVMLAFGPGLNIEAALLETG